MFLKFTKPHKEKKLQKIKTKTRTKQDHKKTKINSPKTFRGCRFSVKLSIIILKLIILGNKRPLIWDELFKNGSSKICRRQPYRPYHFKFFKGCLPQL